MWAERRAPSAPVWLLIVTLHVALLLAWPARNRTADTQRPWTELRLIPSRPVDTSTTPHASPPITPQIAAPAAPPQPVFIPPELDAGRLATPDLPAPTVDIPHDAPLRLTLPDAASSAYHQPAIDDLRGNTPISRIGARIANDLGGDGRWVEERMDADFVRLRRGNTCINLHRARGAVLNPFNESAAPTAWGAGPAYRCERR